MVQRRFRDTKMRSASAVPVRFVHLLLWALVLASRNCTALAEANETAVPEEDDEDLAGITLEEFKERYRRLIPYMTFFVANNYVNNHSPDPQAASSNEAQSSPLVRIPPQSFARPNNLGLPRGNNHRAKVQNPEQKFVPSVRFDPTDVGGDSAYFTPVRYTSKVNYEEYATPYQPYQDRKTVYPEITTETNQAGRKENRYYASGRPLRLYATNSWDQQSRKQTNKPTAGQHRDDYALDYNIRAAGNYPAKDLQGNRYVPSTVYANILDPVPGKLIPHPPRNPNVNLQQIAASFQLSERLPEVLNDDNLDTSLKTLLDILNILHNKKKEEFPQPPRAPLFQGPLPPRLPQAATSLKIRPQNGPKVVTETRFQATPNPLYLTDDPERYKILSYEQGPRPKTPPRPSYGGNTLNGNKLVEYYVPVVQDIPAKDKDVFLPTIRPSETSEGSSGHSYAITEDLSDDIVQENRFTSPPLKTESPDYSYTKPTEASTTESTVPRTSLQYGATRGKARVDYPAYASIPQTNFSCKEQRYKGFFGDPETGCQVWHYCDLNGGKSSFLCPNGTIFSQVALTCDWWFNVKCETTTQLYVLNERLYKYILPVMPKFPEDFTGPEVDRYLELKFKEMETKLKEKKLKKQKAEKEKLKEKQQAQQKNE